MNARHAALVVLLALAAAGCAKKASQADTTGVPGGVSGETSKPGALLAYEHDVAFEVAPDTIQRRIDGVRDACSDERFGACSVLAIDVTSEYTPRGSITMRVVPEGVEKLVALGGNGATITHRKTSAEDLADAVAQVEDRTSLLRRQRLALDEFTRRKDLAVADMISLSHQIAAVDGELQSLGQQSAEQRRRIETNRLSLEFRSNEVRDDSGFSFGEAWSNFSASLGEGANDAAEYAGYFLPLIVLLFPLALAWRWAWRAATKSRRSTP